MKSVLFVEEDYEKNGKIYFLKFAGSNIKSDHSSVFSVLVTMHAFNKVLPFSHLCPQIIDF